jgi:hypothetical protein
MRLLTGLVLLSLLAVSAQNQSLDPTRGAAHVMLERDVHQPLAEQFIWIPGAPGTDHKADREASRYFRTSFSSSAQPAATLYIAGPNTVRAFLNGKKLFGKTVNADLCGFFDVHRNRLPVDL